MKNTALILPILFVAWLIWIIIRPDPLAKFPGYASPGIISIIELPDDGRQLLLVREVIAPTFRPNVVIRDATSGERIVGVMGISEVDSIYFQNDSLYLRTYSVRDSVIFTIRYGVDELQASH